MNKILVGVVGSTAYGLATETSDVDRIGVFAADTRDFHGLGKVTESHVTHEPDLTMHEAGKYCRLALNGNPTVSELMWLDTYDEITELGAELVDIRRAFLSADAVRNAYIGYARQQLTKLINRADGSFAADIPERRAAKHARHLVRLVVQGKKLYTTGHLQVRLNNPNAVRAVAERILKDPDYGRRYVEGAEEQMLEAGTALPARPDTAIVDAWLHYVRDHYYDYYGGPEERR